MARDGGRAGEDRWREGCGMAGGVPVVFLAAAVVLVVVVGAFLIKV
jgi:hypothetical protein